MAAEAVTITPHDARRTAFRAIVAAIKADDALADYVALWVASDGDTDTETATLAVDEHAVRLVPVWEREDVHSVKAGVRTWECPVLVRVETRVASANIDNAINLAGLIESAVASLTPAELRAMGISWLDLVSPPANPETAGEAEYATHTGAFRFVVHIER